MDFAFLTQAQAASPRVGTNGPFDYQLLPRAAKRKTARSPPCRRFLELFRGSPGWLATAFSARPNLAE